MNCPKCQGAGATGPVHVNYGYVQGVGCCGEWLDSVRCYFCGGTGLVPDDTPERIEAGKAKRSERYQRGETLKEASLRMGISAAQLSAIEMGRPLKQPANQGEGS